MTTTPTPWRQEGYRFRDGRKQIMLSYGVNKYHDGPEGYQGFLEMSDDDASFVFSAVNNHEDIMSALRKLVNEVAGLGMFGPEIKELIGVTNWNVLAQRVQEARESIAKAEGRP